MAEIEMSRRGFLGLTGLVAASAGLVGNKIPKVVQQLLQQEEAKMTVKPVRKFDFNDLKTFTHELDLPRRTQDYNLVFVMIDTLRADFLGCYGNGIIQTPHIDRLASQGVMFSNAWGASMPTIPARRVFATGMDYQNEIDFKNSWCPLRTQDITLAEYLNSAGFITHFISDNFQYWRIPGMSNFEKVFGSYERARGQMDDAHKFVVSEDPDLSMFPEDIISQLPDELEGRLLKRSKKELDYGKGVIAQYLANNPLEGGQPNIDLFGKARTFLKDYSIRGGNTPFALVLDCYQTHEVWDPPKKFRELYLKKAPGWGDRPMFGFFSISENVPEEHAEVAKALYSGEVSFVDHTLGTLLDELANLGLADNTIVALVADHGTLLGEEGYVGKNIKYLSPDITRLPLIIKHPDFEGGIKISDLVSAADLMPTFLSLLGVELQRGVDGKNLWDLVSGYGPIHNQLTMLYFANEYQNYTEKSIAITNGKFYGVNPINNYPGNTGMMYFDLNID
ncbi:MAG: sulfatase [archaeon]